ncbi:NAD-dependent epimerase/dehydratase family protein [Algihabitans albus]|uniref:NAD-dependent epimerase/dehydratase family protein n=1 Tax=Algihabitans albus TaxID=2164067 RepID=UPI000E5C9BC8|nr:NAD-dependent epimerase/dehydratase family protein [Algihabitans albus]
MATYAQAKASVLAKAPVAVTGASGFIGRALVKRLSARAIPLRLLLRRPDPELEALGVEVVRGALDREDSLRRLLDGAATLVHCAGAIRARRAADFTAVNETGTARLVRLAAQSASRPRVLLLSSLAAREPGVSAYAGSKLGGERALVREAAGLEHFCLRLPAVYGPGDRATFGLFQQLNRGLGILPAPLNNRFSLLYLSDLENLVEHLLRQKAWSGGIAEVDDGRAGGYAWSELPEIAARQLDRRVRAVSVPQPVLWATAAGSEGVASLLGRAPIWTRGKLNEFSHPDWVSCDGKSSELEGWEPEVQLDQGLLATIAWYRQAGWL